MAPISGTGRVRPAGSRSAAGRASTERATRSTALRVDELLADRHTRIVVCCGSGGVGKTTTAAALALRAAEQGRSVVVLTIDPARRLAQSLGLTALDNTPRPVQGIDARAGGSLEAMMLDMKRTFDEVVLAHSSPAQAEQILANPFYQAVSSSFAGTQEYMAMEKLGQLRARADREGSWDLIVVDTPPSRSALDFLDAPKRLGLFLDGRFIRLISAPARAGGRAGLRLVNVGIGLVAKTLTTVLGGEMLRDVQTFVNALDTMFGGFRERADQTYALLKDGGTAFLVVAAPERDALREASYFVARLAKDGMPLAGLVVNRMQPAGAPGLTADRARAAAEQLGEAGRAESAAALTLHAAISDLATRHHQLVRRFVAGHPRIAVAEVAALAQDVHDLEGLREVGARLAAAATASE